eukprot:1148859-Pelagomonas_calceolata.AAC.8
MTPGHNFTSHDNHVKGKGKALMAKVEALSFSDIRASRQHGFYSTFPPIKDQRGSTNGQGRITFGRAISEQAASKIAIPTCLFQRKFSFLFIVGGFNCLC